MFNEFQNVNNLSNWYKDEQLSFDKKLIGLLYRAIKIKFTGKKFSNKKYYRHTGHPGGIKETTPIFLKEKNKIDQILKLAVKRMLPGGPLAKKQLTKLKIYNGDKHPHDVQKPKIIDFEKLNKRNTAK